ncbi:hypothetical protein LGV61_06510 [Desulfurispirillum indicum]|uniref:STAS domain-containing protein n=1 Tax=Desulfurispirillum indicum (strain ATCC BAA-1389 / DSM 22839 / S5) TaxID=653733 RepID=E6W0B1_DESIS|nr:hypothetical protein [Desulfurispirillum indicum]ADU65979.1 hypothetical protein Selin_1244 [Desulfurispirillum indicum S5]ADU66329.1 hypothetical protein Selin_1599 [Desulfurispirillum indicum S5]UCZ55663.1 hypothetical protein LGV61_07950 [Desulfurispirillum indicum]UCZ57918.1 hypothetical protein LGV61_06510 [Desulfurispirillum indicum]
MFEIDGETLNISLGMDAEDVEQLRQFLLSRIEYIEHIGIQDPRESLGSSSLLQLLGAIRRSHRDIVIDLFDMPLEHPELGRQYWSVP